MEPLPLKTSRLDDEPLVLDAQRLTDNSGGQLHRVTEPSTLGAQAIGIEATSIISVVNTAVVSSATAADPASNRPISTVVVGEKEVGTKAAAGEAASNVSSATANEPAAAAAESKPVFTGYVHKLKKAWMKSYVAEPAASNITDSNGKSAGGGGNSSGGSGNNSVATSPQLTRATPSPAGSTKSTGSGKGFPNAVKSAAEALRVNGYGSDRNKEDEDDLSSGDEEENEARPPPTSSGRSKKKAKPGPKPKGKPGPKPKQSVAAAARRKAQSESDNSDSDSSKTSKKSDSSKKRGRKPGKPVKGGSSGLKDSTAADEPKLKKLKVEEGVGGGAPRDPFAKPSVSQLKKTGESFLQDASCFEVAPKLNKCRECRWSHAQRQKQSLANIFCRFYAFRRLRYTKNGQIAQAGFCDPAQDAGPEDLKLWLPGIEAAPAKMKKAEAETILSNLSTQFYTIYKVMKMDGN